MTERTTAIPDQAVSLSSREKEALITDFEDALEAGNQLDRADADFPAKQKEAIVRLRNQVIFPQATLYDEAYLNVPQLNTILEHLGLPAEEMRDAWTSSFSDRSANEYLRHRNFSYLKNYSALINVEKHTKGSAKVLHDEFGLSSFGRYSHSFLVNQYEQRDEQIPYGIVINPKDDHNGAMFSQLPFLDQIAQRLENTHALRAYEVNGKLGLAKTILRADERYGTGSEDGHVIPFGILAGHGSPTSIQFDKNQHLTTLDTFFLGDNFRHRLQAAFDRNATLLVHSCSTGEDGGMAQQLANILDIKVVAPQESAAVYDVQVEENDGIVSLEYLYKSKNGDPVKVRTYTSEDQMIAYQLDLTSEIVKNPEIVLFRTLESEDK